MSPDCIPDCIIVGAGPVGVIAALGLARAGIAVLVLEAEPSVVESPRAVVYHWAVLDGLDRLGILADVERAGVRKQDYGYRIFKTGEQIRFSMAVLEGHAPHPYNLHLGQHRLAEIALDHLRRLPNASVRFGARVVRVAQDESGVTVTAETEAGPETVRAAWAIGADGGRSAVRRLLGLDFPGTTWPERFVATNLHYDFEAHGLARATFQVDDVEGAVIVKIDDEGLWRCTYSEDAALPEDGVLDRLPGRFRRLLPGNGDWNLVAAAPYRMHQRAAERFRVGRVVLAGDAAHVTNPAGGLGLTSGLFDAFVLSEALAAVIRGETDDAVLDRYAAIRRQIFLERVSPQAAENKRFVYHSGDPARLESDLANLRCTVADPELLRRRLFFLKSLETPSLLQKI
ncbi:MAG TPA: FAD-dependent monooxygenase [Stellaceae bacterium]|nr:FAD-dependent monooxygenase [Stellaceae bacterium]